MSSKIGFGSLCCTCIFLGIIIPQSASAATINVSGNLLADTVWQSSNLYVVDGNFSVPSGVTLTIEPGTIVKVKSSGQATFNIFGRLVAEGSAQSKIYLTSFYNDEIGGDSDGIVGMITEGEWKGLYFGPGSEGILNYVDLSYAGSGDHYVGLENNGGTVELNSSTLRNNYRTVHVWGFGHFKTGYAIYNYNDGTLKVNNTTIDNSLTGIYAESGNLEITNNIFKNNFDSAGYQKGYGLSVFGSGTLTLVNNEFINNQRTAHVDINREFVHSGNKSQDKTNRGFEISGALVSDKTLSAADLPYIVSVLIVENGLTLTLEPGVILKMSDHFRSGSIYVRDGKLVAKGTPEKKIYITSLRNDLVGGDTNGDGINIIPAPRDWASLFLENGSRVEFDHVSLSYGGFNWNGEYLLGVAAAIYHRDGDFLVKNSIFENNAGTSIFQDGGTTLVEGSQFKNSTLSIWSRGGNFKVEQSEFTKNSPELVMYHERGPQIDARNNWWGSSDGPRNTSTTTPTGSGAAIVGDILYIPFLDRLGEIPLTVKAANLAKQVITADYLGDGEKFGGKGWDPKQNLYVTTNEIFDGYNFWNNKLRKVAFGAGLDCSGLIQWAYNRAFDPAKSLLKNVVRYDGADGQYRNNSQAITESELKPGDLLFMDKGSDNFMDHVAMYVGQSDGYDIVEAFSPERGIVTSDKNLFKERNGFNPNKHFRKVTMSPKIAGQVKAGSPIDLVVTSPNGLTVSPNTVIETDEEYLTEIPGELYYSESELGLDGRPEDVVYWPVTKKGDYKIKVTPELGTNPTDTYSLYFTVGENTVTLAQDVPISQIPEEGYGVTVGDDQTINSFVPVQIDIKPDSVINTINLNSKGVLPVAVFGSATFDVGQVDIDSVKLGGAPVATNGKEKPISSESDLNSDGFVDLLIKVDTEALQLGATDPGVSLEGVLTNGKIIKGSDSINIIQK